jgi:hypothetical protein
MSALRGNSIEMLAVDCIVARKILEQPDLFALKRIAIADCETGVNLSRNGIEIRSIKD